MNSAIPGFPRRRGAELLVPSYAIQLPFEIPGNGLGLLVPRAPYFFKSWKAKGTSIDPDAKPPELDFRLKDIARATSAAPTYFPPALIQNREGQSFGMIDGGVFANNPAMCALVSAYKLFPQAKGFMLVSLGTGSLQRPIPYEEGKNWGLVHWARPILNVLFDGNADTTCYEVDQILGPMHYRFDISLGESPKQDPNAVNEDFDYASPDNIARIERKADALINGDGWQAPDCDQRNSRNRSGLRRKYEALWRRFLRPLTLVIGEGLASCHARKPMMKVEVIRGRRDERSKPLISPAAFRAFTITALARVLFADFADYIARRAAATAPLRVLELAAGTGIVTRRLRDVLPRKAHSSSSNSVPGEASIAFPHNRKIGLTEMRSSIPTISSVVSTSAKRRAIVLSSASCVVRSTSATASLARIIR